MTTGLREGGAQEKEFREMLTLRQPPCMYRTLKLCTL